MHVQEEGGGWTGRAQQVSLLQSKVVQLKRELASVREAAKAASSPTDIAANVAPTSPQQMVLARAIQPVAWNTGKNACVRMCSSLMP